MSQKVSVDERANDAGLKEKLNESKRETVLATVEKDKKRFCCDLGYCTSRGI